MKYSKLGKFKVSKLGIGTGQLWKHFTKTGVNILLESYKQGINFWDTSDDYKSHKHVRKALETVPRKKVIIATKIRSRSYKKAEKDVAECLRQLNTDYLDILHLHAVDTFVELKRRIPAFKYLIKAKKQGIIKSIGISTHNIKIVKLASKIPQIDIILLPLNKKGARIEDGTKEQMIEAAKQAKKKGKSIYTMKVLGSCHRTKAHKELAKHLKSSIAYTLKQPFTSSIIIGTESLDELNQNIKIVNSI